jgi:hypothetical protein
MGPPTQSTWHPPTEFSPNAHGHLSHTTHASETRLAHRDVAKTAVQAYLVDSASGEAAIVGLGVNVDSLAHHLSTHTERRHIKTYFYHYLYIKKNNK